jgi:hypothetical protein
MVNIGAERRLVKQRNSGQLIEERLCLLQIGGVEALGEPAVNRREEVPRVRSPALFAP